MAMLKTKEDIIAWLNEMAVENYTINDDLTVDVLKVDYGVYTSVDISNKKLTEIPVQFGVVSADFNCSKNQLNSLLGTPRQVGGGFNCSKNKLTTLIDGPLEVCNYYDCTKNPLKNFDGLVLDVEQVKHDGIKTLHIPKTATIEEIATILELNYLSNIAKSVIEQETDDRPLVKNKRSFF